MTDNEKNNITDNLQESKTTESSLQTDRQPNTAKKEKTILKEILSWVYTIAGAVILAFVITTFIIVNAVVPTESM